MLKELGWESLADRRRQLRLVPLYKIINHLAAVSVDSILIPADSRHVQIIIQVNTTMFRNSFFVATIPSWNSLQAETVKSATVKNLQISTKN